MEWDLAHRRACGFVIEILRQPWTYRILAMLAATPHLQIRDIHRILGYHHRRKVSYATIRHRVAALHEEGLLYQCGHRHKPGVPPYYDVTRLAASITGSLDALGAWALARYGHLTRPAPPPRRRLPTRPIQTPAQRADAATRAAIRATLDLLDKQWCFAILVFSPGAPVTAEELEQRVNDSLEDNPDLLPYRHLHRSQRYEAINHLVTGGLLTHITESRPGARPRKLYAASPDGLGLLAALLPVGTENIRYDAELYNILAMRAGWDEPGH